MSFTAFCKPFFGLKPDQDLKGFAAELRELSHDEKMQLAADARKSGFDCEDPTVPKQAS